MHADLEAPIGTPVLAVADGHVVEVADAVASGGCHVRGFFEYNAITIAHARRGGGPPVFVEYVHVRAGSSRVAVGASVVSGEPIAEVGEDGSHTQCLHSASALCTAFVHALYS
jgi:murein DD-endopeptidase MepM/ murein hydrolase activator NlpD